MLRRSWEALESLCVCTQQTALIVALWHHRAFVMDVISGFFWLFNPHRCHTDRIRRGGNKNLFHGKQQRTIFSQHGCPVRPSPSAALRPATHSEARLWCQMVFVFHPPLNPGGVGPPCEGCYSQHETIWDCWPPPSPSAEDCDSTSAR